MKDRNSNWSNLVHFFFSPHASHRNPRRDNGWFVARINRFAVGVGVRLHGHHVQDPDLLLAHVSAELCVVGESAVQQHGFEIGRGDPVIDRAHLYFNARVREGTAGHGADAAVAAKGLKRLQGERELEKNEA